MNVWMRKGGWQQLLPFSFQFFTRLASVFAEENRYFRFVFGP